MEDSSLSLVTIDCNTSFLVVKPSGKKYDTKEDLAPIAEFIQSLKVKVKGVVLHGNSYSSVAVGELVSTILSLDLLLEEATHFDFSDMFTGRLKDDVPNSLKELGRLLQHAPSLKSLNLSDNAFGPTGAAAISPFLKGLPIESLMINNNGLGAIGGSTIADSLKTLTTLTTLSMGRNRLEDAGASSIATAIRSGFASTLKNFSIFQNGITKKGIIDLCEALSHCSNNLELLDFEDNTFTLEGSLYFASNLIPKISASIKILSLNYCLLTRKGARGILRQMVKEKFSKLLFLGLQYNEISSFEVELVIQLVAQAKSLQSLQLNGNSFDPDILRSSLVHLGQDGILDSLSDMESEDYVSDVSSSTLEESQDESDLSRLLEQTIIK